MGSCLHCLSGCRSEVVVGHCWCCVMSELLWVALLGCGCGGQLKKRCDVTHCNISGGLVSPPHVLISADRQEDFFDQC